jgi:hypothetical protein
MTNSSHDTQHNDIQPNDTQHKGLISDIDHNDTQHNETAIMLNIIVPRVTIYLLVL